MSVTLVEGIQRTVSGVSHSQALFKSTQKGTLQLKREIGIKVVTKSTGNIWTIFRSIDEDSNIDDMTIC
jgi:hypothetical protein